MDRYCPGRKSLSKCSVEETDDQLQANRRIQSIICESKKIMDRLISGRRRIRRKTEIAILAAFKSVQEGKQVVCLVPTTNVAQHHYNTFVQRLKIVSCKNRSPVGFGSAAEQKRQYKDTNKGLLIFLSNAQSFLVKGV